MVKRFAMGKPRIDIDSTFVETDSPAHPLWVFGLQRSDQ